MVHHLIASNNLLGRQLFNSDINVIVHVTKKQAFILRFNKTHTSFSSSNAVQRYGHQSQFNRLDWPGEAVQVLGSE